MTILYGGAGNDSIVGLGESDTLYGESGNDLLFGLAGDDLLDGGNDNDVIVGGEGNDVLSGGEGNDLYYYGFATQGNGVWTIAAIGNDFITDSPFNGGDQIVVDNIDGVNFNLYGTDMGLKVWDQATKTYSGTIWLQNWLLPDEGQRIHQLTMRDGYRYFGVGNNSINYYFDVDISAVGQTRDFTGNSSNQMYYGAFGNDTIIGGDGKDWLSGDLENDSLLGGNNDDDLFGQVGDDFLGGDAGNDFLRGGMGNDTLAGGQGNDVYRIGNGSRFNGELFGNDLILADVDNGNDLLYLRNTSLPQYAARSGNDLTLHFVLTGATVEQTITLQDWYSSGENKVENFLYWDEIFQNVKIQGLIKSGTIGEDNLDFNGNAASLMVFGQEGNDVIVGSSSQDILIGDAGHDHIDGGAGDDILQGGAGNDWLTGGSGNDIYQFGFGTAGNGIWTLPSIGNDTIKANSENVGDRIIVDNIDLFKIDGNNLVLSVWDYSANADVQGTITLENWLLPDEGQRIHNITVREGYQRYFSEGNAPIDYYFDFDTLGISKTSDFTSNTNNPMYFAGLGDDTVLGGSGHNYLSGDSGNDSLIGGANDDDLFGGAANDVLRGGLGNDYLRGGDGSDLLAGGAGNDLYRFGRGDGVRNAEMTGNDIVVSDIANGMDRLYMRNWDMPNFAEQSGNDLVFYYWNSYEQANFSLTLQDWYVGGSYSLHEYRQRSDVGFVENSTYWVEAGNQAGGNIDFSGASGNMIFFGMSGNDTYHGGELIDRVWGGNDADVLYGGGGNDWLLGESGDDVLSGEAGNDILVGGGGIDTLYGGDGADVLIAGGYIGDGNALPWSNFNWGTYWS